MTKKNENKDKEFYFEKVMRKKVESLCDVNGNNNSDNGNNDYLPKQQSVESTEPFKLALLPLIISNLIRKIKSDLIFVL